MRFVTERIVKVQGVPLVNPVYITQILWDENHSWYNYFTLQTPCFSPDSVRIVELYFGSTPPSLYISGCFATDFCSYYFFSLWDDGPILNILSCYKVSGK